MHSPPMAHVWPFAFFHGKYAHAYCVSCIMSNCIYLRRWKVFYTELERSLICKTRLKSLKKQAWKTRKTDRSWYAACLWTVALQSWKQNPSRRCWKNIVKGDLRWFKQVMQWRWWGGPLSICLHLAYKKLNGQTPLLICVYYTVDDIEYHWILLASKIRFELRFFNDVCDFAVYIVFSDLVDFSLSTHVSLPVCCLLSFEGLTWLVNPCNFMRPMCHVVWWFKLDIICMWEYAHT